MWSANISLQRTDDDGTPQEVYSLQSQKEELQDAWAAVVEILKARFKLERRAQ